LLPIEVLIFVAAYGRQFRSGRPDEINKNTAFRPYTPEIHGAVSIVAKPLVPAPRRLGEQASPAERPFEHERIAQTDSVARTELDEKSVPLSIEKKDDQ
jgi:hypothetical protein